MSTPLSTTTDVVESILAPLRERHTEIDAQIAELELQKEPLKDEQKRIARILRAADPKPAPTRRPKAAESRGLRNKDVAKQFFDMVRSMPPGTEFKQVDLRKRIGASSGQTSDTFKVFRDQGLVRFVRQDGNAKFFAPTGDDPTPDLLATLGVEQ